MSSNYSNPLYNYLNNNINNLSIETPEQSKSVISLVPHLRCFTSFESGIEHQDVIIEEDFSLSMWLYSSRDNCNENQILFFRGNIKERIIVCLLVLHSDDSHLEIVYGKDQYESFQSRETLIKYQWNNIVLVYERKFFKLYIRGKLDNQQSTMNNFSGIPTKICLGYIKDQILPNTIENASGYEGYIYQCMYHQKSISPIHIHMLLKNKPILIPPNLINFQERFLDIGYSMRNKKFRKHIELLKWYKFIIKCLNINYSVIKHICNDILYSIFQSIDPADFPINIKELNFNLLDYYSTNIKEYMIPSERKNTFLSSLSYFGYTWSDSSSIILFMIRIIQNLYKLPKWNLYYSSFFHSQLERFRKNINSDLLPILLLLSENNDTFFTSNRILISHTNISSTIISLYESTNEIYLAKIPLPTEMSSNIKPPLYYNINSEFCLPYKIKTNMLSNTIDIMHCRPEEIYPYIIPIESTNSGEFLFKLFSDLLKNPIILEILNSYSKPLDIEEANITKDKLEYSLIFYYCISSIYSLYSNPTEFLKISKTGIFNELFSFSTTISKLTNKFSTILDLQELQNMMKRRYNQLSVSQNYNSKNEEKRKSKINSNLKDIINSSYQKSGSFPSISNSNIDVFYPKTMPNELNITPLFSINEKSSSCYGYYLYGLGTYLTSDEKRLFYSENFLFLDKLSLQEIINLYFQNTLELSLCYARLIIITYFSQCLENNEEIVEIDDKLFFQYLLILVNRGPQLSFYPYKMDQLFSTYISPLFNKKHKSWDFPYVPVLDIVEQICTYYNGKNKKYFETLSKSITQFLANIIHTFKTNQDQIKRENWGKRNLYLSDEECTTKNAELYFYLYSVIFSINSKLFLNELFLSLLLQSLSISNIYYQIFIFNCLSSILREFLQLNDYPFYFYPQLQLIEWKDFFEYTIYNCNTNNSWSIYDLSLLDCIISVGIIFQQYNNYFDVLQPLIPSITYDKTSIILTFLSVIQYGIFVEIKTKNDVIIEYYIPPSVNQTIVIDKYLPQNVEFHFRFKIYNLFYWTSWSNYYSGVVFPIQLFRWNIEPFNSSIMSPSDDHNILICNQNHWTTILGDFIMSTGYHEWTIKIEDLSFGNMLIGISTENIETYSYIGNNKTSFGYMSDGGFYTSGESRTYGEKYSMGDLVTIIFNSDTGILSFKKNGVEQGIAIDNIYGNFCPAVSLNTAKQQIKLVSYESDDYCDCITPIRDEFLLDRIIQIQEELESCIYRRKFNNIYSRELYDQYMSWLNNEIVVFNNTVYSSSADELKQFGFSVLQTVITPLGCATVFGLNNNKLYFYIHESKIVKSFSKKTLSFIKVIFTPEVKQKVNVDFKEFEVILSSDIWNKQVDTALSLMLPSLINNKRFVYTDIESKLFQFEINMNLSKFTIKPLLILDIRCFWIFRINKFITPFLSKIDLSFHNGWFTNSFQNYSGLYFAGLIHEARYLFYNKSDLFFSLIDTTRSMLVPEDLDYPSDLLMVIVNRHRANIMKENQNKVIRLSNSMFHQIFEQLHYIEISLLKVMYKHPSDDGQYRTFRVKYEGEGCDDYGGPYREVFYNIVEELVTLTEDSRNCILPLLLPSPNFINQIKDSSLTYICNPGLFRVSSGYQTYLELFHFIGQLMGIAVQSRVFLSIDFVPYYWKIFVGQELEMEDLKTFDYFFYDSLVKLRESYKENKETFQYMVDNFTWSYLDSTSFSIDIKPNGSNISLTINDKIDEYINKVVQFRFSEVQPAIMAIKDGITSILPISSLSLMTWAEFREIVCGPDRITVDDLKANVFYDQSIVADTQLIDRFWSTLETFSERDLSLFLLFVSGRSKIIKNSSQKFKILKNISTDLASSLENMLPTVKSFLLSSLILVSFP